MNPSDNEATVAIWPVVLAFFLGWIVLPCSWILVRDGHISKSSRPDLLAYILIQLGSAAIAWSLARIDGRVSDLKHIGRIFTVLWLMTTMIFIACPAIYNLLP